MKEPAQAGSKTTKGAVSEPPAPDLRGSAGGLGRRNSCGSGYRGRLLGDVAGARGVHPHAGTLARRERDRAQVAALGGGRLRADHLVEERGVVLEEGALLHVGLADTE